MRQKKIKLLTLYSLLLSFFAFVFSAEAFAAGVSLVAVPTTQTVTVGQTATYTIKINRDNYTDKVTLLATGLPSGVTATFNPNTTTAASSTLKLQTLTTTPIGTFNINVKGTANGISIAPIVVKLTTTAAPALSLSILPESQSIVAGQKTFYDIVINRTGFSGPVVLTADNVPSGASVLFEPQETTGNTSRMWLFSGGLPRFPQNYEINVTGKPRDLPDLQYKKKVRFIVNCDIVWSEQGFPEFNPRADFATAVTSDSAGNVYIAGHHNGNEVWVAKYSSSGTRIWLRTITLNNVAGFEKHVGAIAVDNPPVTTPATFPNIYVAGSTQTSNTQVNFDAFIAKFDSNGNQLGSNIFGDNPTEDGTFGMQLGFDSSGLAVLTAAFDIDRESILDPMYGTFDVANFDINRITFDANLNIIAGYPFDLATDIVGDPKDLTVGSDGSIYVVGRDLNYGAHQYFGWVMKFNSNGGQLYNNPFSTPYFPTRVAGDSSGNAFVAGIITRSIAGLPIDDDVWLSKIDPQRNQLWTTFDATNAQETIGDLTVDANGNVIYNGSTRGNLAAANPDGKADGWIAKRNGSGVLFFQRQFAVLDKDGFEAIALDNAGNALLAGNTVSFNNVNYGVEDVLLIKYSLSGTIFVPFFITRPTPASVRGGTQFTIEGGNFFGITGIYFDGQPLAFTVVSSTRITATAPNVTTSRTANLTVSANCDQLNSPIQLTVTP